jgi:hypothetical protein
MAKIGRRPLDDEQLEGGGAGAGISGTKYSKMPSLRGSASTIGDLRKINQDTSNLRGNAKKVTEDAQDRAAARTGVRAAGAGAAAAGIKTAVSDDSEDKKDDKTPSRAGMGEIISGKGMADGGKVPVQQLPYMGEKPESRIPPPAQRSKPNSEVKIPSKNYSGGGTASSRADGCATKGKTKGRFV